MRLSVHSEEGAITFLGLKPGEYTLRLLLPDKTPLEQQVQQPGRVRHAIVFKLDAPPVTETHEGEPPAAAGAATTTLGQRGRQETR